MRIERNEYFMQMAELSAKRSTCETEVGAVAVKDNRVIMTAYNGSPPGMEHCKDWKCYEINGHCERTVHAEQNIITQCAMRGVKLKGAEIYCTHEPCMTCQKLLISSGVKKVYYRIPYEDERLLKEYNKHIELIWLSALVPEEFPDMVIHCKDCGKSKYPTCECDC